MELDSLTTFLKQYLVPTFVPSDDDLQHPVEPVKAFAEDHPDQAAQLAPQVQSLLSQHSDDKRLEQFVRDQGLTAWADHPQVSGYRQYFSAVADTSETVLKTRH